MIWYDNILVWPEYGWQGAAWVGVILVLMAAPAFAVIAFYGRRMKRQQAWVILSTFAARRSTTVREMNLLRTFFDSLTHQEAQVIVHERGRLRTRLFDYLRSDDDDDERLAVRLIDKLFPDMKHWHEVLSPADVQPGEICAVEYGTEHLLARYVGPEEELMLVSLPSDAAPPNRGIPASIFVYRPKIGGYLLHGTVSRSFVGGLAFQPSGRIQVQSEQHLMALWDLPIVLKPWPPAGPAGEVEPLPAEVEDGLEAGLSGAANKEAAAAREAQRKSSPRRASEVRANATRVSDRALLFDSQEPALREGARPELWELETTIPGGFRLTCRGKLLAMPRIRGRYLFKFVDLAENARRVLMAEIKTSDPVRENFTT